MEGSQLINVLNFFENSNNNLIIILKTNNEIEEVSKNLNFFNKSIKIVKYIE